VTALPAHVALEAYSVLTRLPGGLAVPPAVAAAVLAERFGGKLLELATSKRARALRTFAESGVSGGAAYDGLVALEAAAHDRTLLTLDRRALGTYQRLGIPFRLIAA
jgi:toxin FitB